MEFEAFAPDETLEEIQEAEPFPVQVIGYLRGAKGKVTEEKFDYQFSADGPYGEFVDFLVQAGQPGSIGRALRYIEAALLNDEERQRFEEMLHMPNLRLNPKLIDKLSTALVEHYSGRPTSSRSGSARGPNRAARRSAGGAGSRASASSANGRPG